MGRSEWTIERAIAESLETGEQIDACPYKVYGQAVWWQCSVVHPCANSWRIIRDTKGNLIGLGPKQKLVMYEHEEVRHCLTSARAMRLADRLNREFNHGINHEVDDR